MTCRSCGKEIVFLKTKKGKSIPVNAETVHVQEKQTIFDVAKGNVPHFSDCPEASKWRKDK